MTFVAESSIVVNAASDACFATFVDFPAWHEFMPPSYRPVAGPARALRANDRVRIRIAGLGPVVTIRISHIEPDREIAWHGGVRGVLAAAHRFVFEVQGDRATRVRSEETWTGALSVGPLALAVKARAEQIGAEQLAGFRDYMARASRT